MTVSYSSYPDYNGNSFHFEKLLLALNEFCSTIITELSGMIIIQAAKLAHAFALLKSRVCIDVKHSLEMPHVKYKRFG